MSDHHPTVPPQATPDYLSTEEMVAAQAANEGDLLYRAQADLAALQAKSADLNENFPSCRCWPRDVLEDKSSGPPGRWSPHAFMGHPSSGQVKLRGISIRTTSIEA